MPSHARPALPTVGAALFFEGHEYQFQVSEKPGHLSFIRPDDATTPHKRVTLAAAELARSTGAKLAPAAAAEAAAWLRGMPGGLPAETDAKLRKQHEEGRALYQRTTMQHARDAEDRLAAGASRQFYHLEVDGQSVRLIQPPIELPALAVPLPTRAAVTPGAVRVTQTSPTEEV